MKRDESKMKDGVVILSSESDYRISGILESEINPEGNLINGPIGKYESNSQPKGCPSHEEASCEEEYDYIKPNHYQLFPGMKDTFEIHKAYLTKEEYIGWLKGTILKYKIRMGEKPGESFDRDMAKINVYREEMRKIIKNV